MERNVRVSKRFLLISAIGVAALIGIVVGVVLLLQEMTGHVRRMAVGEVYAEIETKAVVIRSEQSYTESASDAKIIAESGSYIEEGADVAVLYPYGYETALASICSQESALYTKLELQLKAMNDNELPESVQALGTEIAAVGARMRAASNGESEESYTDLEAELLQLLKDRRDLMVSLLSDASTLASEIRTLEAQYTQFETNMARTIRSAYNGYISFYTDSNEEPLHDVSQLTVSQVRRVLASTSFAVNSEDFSYRIVTDRSTFYLAFVASTTSSADRSKRLMPNKTYTFTIKGVDGAFMGTVISEKDSANGILYVMAVQSDVKPVLDARVVEIVVQNVATGLVVPTDYIQYSNGVPYVFIKTDYGYAPIAVYIAGSDGEDAVIAARDEKLTLFAGLRYRMPIEEDD